MIFFLIDMSLIDRSINWFSWSIDDWWFVDWLIDLLTDSFIEWLIGYNIQLIDWLTNCLINGPTEWLID